VSKTIRKRSVTSSVIILQRIVPHYRLPLFRRLNQEFGWIVACAREVPSGGNFSLVKDEPFIRGFEFDFPDPENLNRCKVPTKEVLDATGAKAVIAEFALGMSSTRELLLRRRFRSAPTTVFWSHGLNMGRGFDGWEAKLNQAIRVGFSALADAHICYSEEGRFFLRRYLKHKKLFLAPNTLDVVSLCESAQQIGRLPGPGNPSLLAIGRLTPSKAIPRLVRIFKTFLQDFPNAVLTIIGDGPDYERIREEGGELLDSSVRMMGSIYDEEELARHFCATDLVVFAGQAGLSVNHALAYGTPILAFDRTPKGPHHSPEIAYVVDEVTGARVREYSDEAFRARLVRFFQTHPDPRGDFEKLIRDYLSQNLSLERMVDGFREVDRWLREERGIG